MGPLALLDEVGLDVAAKVGVVLERAFPDRMRAHPLLPRLTNEGRLGKKGGRGFYLYRDGRRDKPDKGLRAALGLGERGGRPGRGESAEAPVYDDAYLVARCLYPMVNEAARALDERIVATADDGDLALVMGMGWPPFRGGLLRWADEVGIGPIVQRLEEWSGSIDPRFAPSESLRARRRGGFHGLSPDEAQPRLEGL
jgi:3-hydroxyacyl-CoA dehydrogenase/enoyl-CoA hydratase/3-hydroxybutyryl-CoA epimerase